MLTGIGVALTLACAALSTVTAGADLYSGLEATTDAGMTPASMPKQTWIETNFDSDQLRERYRGWDWQGTNLCLRGWLVAPSGGTYVLDIASHGQRDALVDGRSISHESSPNGHQLQPVPVDLEPGIHPISVVFTDLRHDPFLRALWAVPGGQLVPIPHGILYARAPSRIEAALVLSPFSPPIGSLAAALLMASFLITLGFALGRAADTAGGRAIARWFAKERYALALLLGAGILARIVMALATRTVLWPDSLVYYRQAVEIASQHDFSGIHRGPVFPALLALFKLAFHGTTVGLSFVNFQRLLGLVSTVFFYKVARRVAGPVASFACALAFSLHTLLLNYEAVVQTEALFTVLLSIQLWLLLRTLESPATSWARYAAIGLLGGVLALTRPVAQLLILIVPLILIVHRRSLRRAAAPALTVCFFGMLLVGPWMYYKHRTEGYWGISLEKGRNLFFRVYDLDDTPPPQQTRYPAVAGAYRLARREREVTYYAVQGELKNHWRMSPVEVDRSMFGFAMEAIEQHPFLFLVHRTKSLTTIFLRPHNSIILSQTPEGPWLCGLRPEESVLAGFPTNPPQGFRLLREIMAFWMEHGYVRLPILVALFLVGIVAAIIRGGGRRAAALVLLVIVLYFTGSATAFNLAEDRYRLPVDAAILALAFLGLEALAGWDLLTRWVATPVAITPGPAA